MFGFLLGTFCLIGLIGMARGSWHHRWHAHGPYRHWHGRGWGPVDDRSEGPRAEWRGARFMGEGFGRAAAEMIKRRLRVDEDQSDIVDHALKDVRAAVHEYVEVLKASRPELGAAFRGETVDEAAIAAVFARHDDELTGARREVLSALKQIHAVLTPEQRKTGGDWIGSTDTRWV